jgi:hypothetical protein
MTKKITGGWEWPWKSNTSTTSTTSTTSNISNTKPNVATTTVPSNSFTSNFTLPSFLKSNPVVNKETQQQQNQVGGKRKTKKSKRAKKSKKSKTSKAKK